MTTTTCNPTAAVCPSYNQLQTKLNKLVASGPAHQVLPLSLAFLSKPHVLGPLLTRAAHSTTWLQKVQAASYYHKNGFDKIVLLSGNDFKLRLHHFRPQNGLLPAENIHDHRWPFASSVIDGQLHMKRFEPNQHKGQPVQEYRYHSNRNGDVPRAEFVQASHLETTEYIIYETGTQYFMPTTVLHQIVYMPGHQALTLVLTGRPERTTCRLFANGILQEEDMQEEAYKTGFLKQKLLSLAKEILKPKPGKL